METGQTGGAAVSTLYSMFQNSLSCSVHIKCASYMNFVHVHALHSQMTHMLILKEALPSMLWFFHSSTRSLAARLSALI